MALFQRKDTDFSQQNTASQNSSNKGSADSHKKASGSQSGNSAEFAIGDLIKLLHSLPQQNFDAEISAVVRTIASFDINIQNLIDDINHQETLAKKRMKVLELEIELFKAKIKNRQKEMDLLQIGAAELSKSKDCLAKGLKRIGEENNTFTQRVNKKRAARLKKIPELDNPMPITEKIKIAASKEIDHINKQSKIKSLRNKFKKRFARG
ncbi:MAG: hypothetical protein PVF82_03565 [Gammaproteobacteria bacterium]|jgi:hypothetical protein